MGHLANHSANWVTAKKLDANYNKEAPGFRPGPRAYDFGDIVLFTLEFKVMHL